MTQNVEFNAQNRNFKCRADVVGGASLTLMISINQTSLSKDSGHHPRLSTQLNLPQAVLTSLKLMNDEWSRASRF